MNEKNNNEIEELKNSIANKIGYKQSLLRKLKWYEQKYGPYYETKGLKNWKNLFRKPTTIDWIVLALWVLILFMAYAYSFETKQCRETLENLPTEVCEACREFHLNKGIYGLENSVDFGEINITLFVDDAEVGE